MNTLNTERVAFTLQRLFQEAEQADKGLMDQFGTEHSDAAIASVITGMIAEEQRDLHGVYRGFAENFLNITAAYGQFLYQCARIRKAARIIEFGTSMGVSTIYLAAALRDNGGGQLISTELEPGKAARARANLEAAGLADLVEIHLGDARDTLRDAGDGIDLVLLDGAFSLYLPVLKLLEPSMRAGTPILAENAFDYGNEYLAYVREPANGYQSQALAINDGRGNEFSVRTR